MIYDVLILVVEQSESVLYIYIYIYIYICTHTHTHTHRHTYTLFLKFFSHIAHYKALSRVPCAINSRSNAAATAAKSLQSCPTLCDPIDSSLPDSRVPGILQAKTLECVAISFSSA